MQVIKKDSTIKFIIEAQRNKTNQIICFALGTFTLILGVAGLFIETEFIAINLLFLIIMIYISLGYWEGFVWQIRGYETILVYQDMEFSYHRQSLTKWFKREGKIIEKGIYIYDNMVGPSDPPPRSDGYIGAHGGKIIVWFTPNKSNGKLIKKEPTFFRFGKSLTDAETNLILKEINQLWSEIQTS